MDADAKVPWPHRLGLICALVVVIAGTLVTAMLVDHRTLKLTSLAVTLAATCGLVLVAFGQLGLAVDRALKHHSRRRSS